MARVAGKGSEQFLLKACEIARSKGGKCLSGEYLGSDGPLDFICERGHQWTSKYRYIARGNWCPKCPKNGCYSIKDVQDYVSLKGGKCLSARYVNSNSKLSFECPKGHRWETRFSSIKRGHWCPSCAGRKSITLQDAQELARKEGGECFP